MKASELRIGNLLIFSNMIQPDRIIAVDRRFFSSASIEEGSGDFEITPYYQPIELTPEILEKAGFVTIGRYAIGVGGYNVFAKGRIELLQPNEGDPYILAFYEAKITHLHQLQNLYFALTGQELAINL